LRDLVGPWGCGCILNFVMGSCKRVWTSSTNWIKGRGGLALLTELSCRGIKFQVSDWWNLLYWTVTFTSFKDPKVIPDASWKWPTVWACLRKTHYFQTASLSILVI
jgi:hypothetical protein